MNTTMPQVVIIFIVNVLIKVDMWIRQFVSIWMDLSILTLWQNQFPKQFTIRNCSRKLIPQINMFIQVLVRRLLKRRFEWLLLNCIESDLHMRVGWDRIRSIEKDLLLTYRHNSSKGQWLVYLRDCGTKWKMFKTWF